MKPSASPVRWVPQRHELSQRLAQIGSICALAAAINLMPLPALAAQRIYLTYGPFGRSIAIRDLRTFVDTGKLSSDLSWYLNFGKVEPESFRQVLTDQISLNGRLVDRIASTIPGEYVLYQVGRIVHTKSRRARTQILALRSTLILSTIDDNKLSLLEFLEKYPTPEVYVDGVILARTARRVGNFVRRIEPTIAVIQEFLSNLICDCDSASK